MPVDNGRDGERMRELLSEHADHALAAAPELSADDIIRRSRRRRAPRQAAVGGVSALAVAGLLIVAVPAVTNTGLFGAPNGVESASVLTGEERFDGGAPEASDTREDAADSVALACDEGAPLPASSYKGLAVSLTAHAVPDGTASWRIDAVVELANHDSRQSRSSGIAWASFALTQDGVPVAHGMWYPEDAPVMQGYLAPGDSASHSMSFVPEWCDGVPLSGEFELTVGVTSSVYFADLVSEPILLAIR